MFLLYLVPNYMSFTLLCAGGPVGQHPSGMQQQQQLQQQAATQQKQQAGSKPKPKKVSRKSNNILLNYEIVLVNLKHHS